MDQKLFRSILMIITYTVLLVLVILQFDKLLGMLGHLLQLLKPVYIGFALAFVLNRPCQGFYRLYHRGLGRTRADRLSRPLAVVSSYVLLLMAVIVIISFIIPKVVESVQIFAAQLGGYLYNLQNMVVELLSYLNMDNAIFELLPDIPELTSYLRNLLNGLVQGLSNTVMGVVSFTSSLISMVVTGMLSIIFSIYMLGGREKLLPQCRRLLRAYTPSGVADRVLEVVRLTSDTFTNFVTGQLIEACILGALCAAGMLFIQADYAPLVGVIIGVLPDPGGGRLHRRDPGRLPSGDGLAPQGAHLPGFPGHPPADRRKRHLSPGGGHLHRPARHLGADGGDCGRRALWSAGHPAQRSHCLRALRTFETGCAQTPGPTVRRITRSPPAIDMAGGDRFTGRSGGSKFRGFRGRAPGKRPRLSHRRPG